jgi:alpha-beta hydrolase superfamily lysophospholipase
VTGSDRATATVVASVDVKPPDGETAAVVIVLSGGKADSFDLADARKLTAVRMRPFAAVLHRRGRRRGITVWTLRYRYRGWNGDERSPVADVQWALDEVRRRHGDLPVVLVGHSMGGRAALAIGGDPLVCGVCALAPWTLPADPFDQLAGRDVLIVHGTRDFVTSPRGSRAYARHAAAAGARVGYIALPGETHAMLFRWRTWHRLAAGFALGALGVAPMPREIEAAFAAEL